MIWFNYNITVTEVEKAIKIIIDWVVDPNNLVSNPKNLNALMGRWLEKEL